MEITEVRIKLVSANNDKLRAFCSITIDNDFVVRDLKVIEGARGPFVAMPSRKLTQRCPRCGGKNPHRASFCNDCGARLSPEKIGNEAMQRLKLHADIAHPINSRCREIIQKCVLDRYADEIEKSTEPNYMPTDLDAFEEDYLTHEEPGDLSMAKRDGEGQGDEAGEGAEPAGQTSRAPEASWEAQPSASPGGNDRGNDLSGGAGYFSQRPQDVEPLASAEPPGDFGPGASLGGAQRGTFRETPREERRQEDFREHGGRHRRRGHGGAHRRGFEPQAQGGGRGRWSRGNERQEPGQYPPRGDAYSSVREGARRSQDSRGDAPSWDSRASSDESAGRDRLSLFPKESFAQKRRLEEAPEAEPEDNFGAGIFS